VTSRHTPESGWQTLALTVVLVASAFALVPSASRPLPSDLAPQRGLTAGEAVASAYDVALNAEFERMPAVLESTCGPAPRVACLGLQALATWWEILLDPQSRFLDARFVREVDAAIGEAQKWTAREPQRAEAWFYLGAALGTRGQWRVLRQERLAAARDGKRIKAALERALVLDPAMHDAAFGIGAYRYYADIAPASLRWLRWLLLLPGGNRSAGWRRWSGRAGSAYWCGPRPNTSCTSSISGTNSGSWRRSP
jgi:hypothetical protein